MPYIHWLHSPCWLTSRLSQLLFALAAWLEEVACEWLTDTADAIATWGSERCR